MRLPCLRSGGIGTCRHLLQSLHQFDIARQILRLESRMFAPAVVLRKIIDALDLAGEQATAQRRIPHKTDAQPLAGG